MSAKRFGTRAAGSKLKAKGPSCGQLLGLLPLPDAVPCLLWMASPSSPVPSPASSLHQDREPLHVSPRAASASPSRQYPRTSPHLIKETTAETWPCTAPPQSSALWLCRGQRAAAGAGEQTEREPGGLPWHSCWQAAWRRCQGGQHGQDACFGQQH